MERSKDWLRQAEKDLKHAIYSCEKEDYEWACFSSQQAAEKALKAIYNKNNIEAKGHSILGLLKGLNQLYEIPEKFFYYGRVLSRYYIETRYPNGFPEGAPMDYFDEKLAKEAINAAREIFEWCKNILNR